MRGTKGLSRLGLSPRMRGNPLRLLVVLNIEGSIPAHAGQPSGGFVVVQESKVYPRACGATGGVGGAHQDAAGLSPRMRGNPAPCAGHDSEKGSIPAHAGQPTRALPRTPRRQVYPRACGATNPRSRIRGKAWGLSPRMRGNLSDTDLSREYDRSIPAHAGQPECSASRWTLR